MAGRGTSLALWAWLWDSGGSRNPFESGGDAEGAGLSRGLLSVFNPFEEEEEEEERGAATCIVGCMSRTHVSHVPAARPMSG